VRNAYIIMEMLVVVVRISETSVNFNETTRRYIPESHIFNSATAARAKYLLF
jgi:hypothetical protein